MSGSVEKHLEEVSEDWLLFFEDQVNELAVKILEGDMAEYEAMRRKNNLSGMIYKRANIGGEEFSVFMEKLEQYIDPRSPGTTLRKQDFAKREEASEKINEIGEVYLDKARYLVKDKIRAFVEVKGNIESRTYIDPQS